jgi:hypothetical protein
MIRCDMCHKPLKSVRHRIARGPVTLTVGPDCFKKEMEAAARLADPAYKEFMDWMRANKGGSRPCPAGDSFKPIFKFWKEGGRW